MKTIITPQFELQLQVELVDSFRRSRSHVASAWRNPGRQLISLATVLQENSNGDAKGHRLNLQFDTILKQSLRRE